MQRILSKRVLRDIREKSCFGIWHCFCLVALVMYMVVAIVGAAETIMQGTKESGRVHHREDGQFGVFCSADRKRDCTDHGKRCDTADGVFPWIFIWDSQRFVSIRQENR